MVGCHSQDHKPGVAWRKEFEYSGRRVIGAQRLMQALGDPMPGPTSIDGRPYFVRQMKNMKASMSLSLMTGAPFDFWAFLRGALLARAHARAESRCGYRVIWALRTPWTALWPILPKHMATRPSTTIPRL